MSREIWDRPASAAQYVDFGGKKGQQMPELAHEKIADMDGGLFQSSSSAGLPRFDVITLEMSRLNSILCVQPASADGSIPLY